MRTVSIQTRLLSYYLLLSAMLAAVALYAILQLSFLDGLTNSIRSKWFAGTAMLGEMADLLSEMHIDQLHTMLIHPEVSTEEAAASGERHVAALDELKAAYRPLAGPEERALFDAFDKSSAAYIAEHRDFMANVAATSPASEHLDDRLGGFYRAADDDVDALITANAAGADADAASADAANERAFYVLLAAAIAGLVIAGWTIVVIRRRISRPLGEITTALSALTAGETGVTVPGADRHDEIGTMARAFDVFRQNATDLALAHEATEQAHARAEAAARHDALTGLPNRRVFSERLEEAVARAGEDGRVHAVLLIDLDRFKAVNDTYGHAAGDQVLCEVADRLKNEMRRDDIVSRLGGDEFAVISAFDGPAQSFADVTRRLASRLIASIAEPITLDNGTANVGASIGIANCRTDGADAEALLHAADIAMYRAKREGRGSFRFFEPGMDVELKARIAQEADLRRAVTAGEIRPHYQPLMALGESRLIGFEILARWHHPTRGIVMPDEFIPLAEEIDVIEPLTYGLLRDACRDAAAWPGNLMLSLNVAPVQLKDTMLPTRILAILSEAGFPPHRLQIEITETALVRDLETARSILATLQSLGIRIALDDFGTGYSSLYHLRELHLDQIKIDRSFIESIRDNPESEKIVNAILGLSRSLGLPTTAEGIEDADTLGRMVANGCTFGQGFIFAAAMPAAEAAAFAGEQMPGRASA